MIDGRENEKSQTCVQVWLLVSRNKKTRILAGFSYNYFSMVYFYQNPIAVSSALLLLNLCALSNMDPGQSINLYIQVKCIYQDQNLLYLQWRKPILSVHHFYLNRYNLMQLLQ